MRTASVEFLRSLIHAPSPSGQETRGQRVWLDYVSQYADETYSDAYGNCVAVLNKGGSPRLMLSGHADEIAMSVVHITEDGYLRIRAVGGVDAVVTAAQRVVVHAKGGPVKGVIGSVPPHLLRGEERKLPKLQDLWVDIGASSRKDAEKLVRIGDLMTLVDDFDILRGDIAVARAFDNRIGTFAVAETLRLLSEARGGRAAGGAGKRGAKGAGRAARKAGSLLQAEVCAVSNIMEEVGLFGARQIAYSLQPDIALVVDVNHATDYPGVSKDRHGDIRMGKGPTLTHGGGNHREVVARLEAVAARERIPVQHEAGSDTTGTDTDVIFWTRGGIPSALISLPNRYMHSPVELVHLGDLENIPRLMAAFARSLRRGESFKIRI